MNTYTQPIGSQTYHCDEQGLVHVARNNIGTLYRAGNTPPAKLTEADRRNIRFALMFGARYASQLPRYSGNIKARIA